MSFLTEIDGWTPVVDALVKEHGLVTAAVFGAVWRYCQMDGRACSASLEVIGERLKLDKATVMRHVKVLCNDGYLKDLTPTRRNAPHVYADTGKAKIVGSIQAATALESHTKRGQSVTENNTNITEEAPQTVAENNSLNKSVAENNSLPQTVAQCNATVAESQLKIDSKKESIIDMPVSKNGTAVTGEKKNKPLTENQRMFGALAQICEINWQIAPDHIIKNLNQSEKILRTKAQATPEELLEFGEWWKVNDWRGQKGQPPTPAQVREMWQRFKNTQQPKRMVLK